MIRFAILFVAFFAFTALNAHASGRIFDPITMNWIEHDGGGAASPKYRRKKVSCDFKLPKGSIHINQKEKYLHLVLGEGKCMRYGIGVGRPGFKWSGTHRITRKAEWPGWTPPAAMRKRQPELPRYMEGGPNNPLGARALYIGSTIYRIHGTNVPSSIGTNVSSGCIRLTNNDVKDLYQRVGVGAKVVVTGYSSK